MEYNKEETRLLESIYLTDDAAARRKTVINALAPGIDDQVIDIGTGPGFVTLELAERVGRSGSVAGVDTSESSLKLAQNRCQHLPQVTLQPASATDLPFTSSTFDCAVSVQVFEYIESVEAAISEMHRVLKPGGRAAIIATDWDSIIWNASDTTLMKNVLQAWTEHCAHTNLPRTLIPKLRAGGFTVLSANPLQQFATDFSQSTYAYHVVPFVGNFVTGRQGLSAADTDRWAQDLDNCAQRGEYLFWLNQLMVVAQKPQ
jgi:ubiquinone/menaquinone biosynthesis C-methylase UbiE